MADPLREEWVVDGWPPQRGTPVWPTRAEFSVINTLLSTRNGRPLREEQVIDD